MKYWYFYAIVDSIAYLIVNYYNKMSIKYANDRDIQYILSGIKTHIAFINNHYWKNAMIGDIIMLTDPELLAFEQSVCITGVSYFKNFGDAWFTYDQQVFPDNKFTSIQDVVKFFNYIFDIDEINEHGVVVFSITK